MSLNWNNACRSEAVSVDLGVENSTKWSKGDGNVVSVVKDAGESVIMLAIKIWANAARKTKPSVLSPPTCGRASVTCGRRLRLPWEAAGRCLPPASARWSYCRNRTRTVRQTAFPAYPSLWTLEKAMVAVLRRCLKSATFSPVSAITNALLIVSAPRAVVSASASAS